MPTKETLTVLAILAATGCAGWHIFPKETVPASGEEDPATQQSEKSPPAPSKAPEGMAYQRAVLAKVKENWVPPEGTPSSVSCTVRVKQFPDGEVISASVVDSCGSMVLDGSVIRAVYRASPLPKPDDPAFLDQELQFTFSVP